MNIDATKQVAPSLSVSQITGQGLTRILFADFYGEPCHALESSLEEECAIWLGVECAPRKMLLTREHMVALMPVFQHFVETGRLPSVSNKVARTT